jgi:hypothetical protein
MLRTSVPLRPGLRIATQPPPRFAYCYATSAQVCVLLRNLRPGLPLSLLRKPGQARSADVAKTEACVARNNANLGRKGNERYEQEKQDKSQPFTSQTQTFVRLSLRANLPITGQSCVCLCEICELLRNLCLCYANLGEGAMH